MITPRLAKERGRSKTDWLDSYHTFSFDTYNDPKYRGIGKLRVINEDFVKPGQGFPMHPHRDMEIITYVMEGALEHKDSMGNGSVIRAGDVQRMSAGTGVLHSEFNPSTSEVGHFIQIWIYPQEKGITPEYEQRTMDVHKHPGEFRLIASHDGSQNSMRVNQNVKLYAAYLSPGEKLDYSLEENHYAWIQIAKGIVKVNDVTLHEGDGAAIEEERELHIEAKSESEILLFDMND
jgi:quercetin 2,3-dioxygenase